MTKEINKLLADLQKTFGADSVMKLSEIPPYDVISTGSLSLDYAIGIGGLPSNRVVELFGEEGAGKTTLALHMVNNYLKQFPDKAAVFIDMEHRLETAWASNFIGDIDRLIVLKPDSAEQGVDMVKNVGRSGQISVLVWDSIGGSPTEKSTEIGKNAVNFAGNAVIISALARFASTLAGKYNWTFIGINQAREDMSGYNQPVTPGGRAWKHACSLRIQVKKAPKSKDGERFEKINGEELRVGYQVLAKVIKSSVGIVGRVANYWFYNVQNSNGFGIDRVDEVATLATLTEVIERRGGWHYHEFFPDGKILGLVKVKEFLRENPDKLQSLFDITMAKMQSGTVDMTDFIPVEDPDADIDADLHLVRTTTLADVVE